MAAVWVSRWVSTPMIHSVSPARLTVVSSVGAMLEQRHRPGGKLPRQSCDESRPTGPDKLLIRPVEGGQAGAGSTRDMSLARHAGQAVGHARSHPAPPGTNPGRPQPPRPVPT